MYILYMKDFVWGADNCIVRITLNIYKKLVQIQFV